MSFGRVQDVYDRKLAVSLCNKPVFHVSLCAAFGVPSLTADDEKVRGRAPGLSGKRSTFPANGSTGEANP